MRTGVLAAGTCGGRRGTHERFWKVRRTQVPFCLGFSQGLEFDYKEYLRVRARVLIIRKLPRCSCRAERGFNREDTYVRCPGQLVVCVCVRVCVCAECRHQLKWPLISQSVQSHKVCNLRVCNLTKRAIAQVLRVCTLARHSCTIYVSCFRPTGAGAHKSTPTIKAVPNL